MSTIKTLTHQTLQIAIAPLHPEEEEQYLILHEKEEIKFLVPYNQTLEQDLKDHHSTTYELGDIILDVGETTTILQYVWDQTKNDNQAL